MSSVLVVDDAAVDRRLIGELLARDSTLEVEFAHDGREALQIIQARLPNLVVTDLVMPNLDGLELVAAVRRDYPLLPVILVTGKGNEEVAVQALQQGAASYVTKRMLAQDLLDTIRTVLAVSVRQRGHWRLLGCMKQSNCAFELENDCTLFGPLISYLQEAVTQVGVCDDRDNMRIGVALEEALSNALYRGNMEVGSELRAIDDRAYHALVRRRQQERPYCERKIHVEARLSHEKAVFIIRDDGPGFDPSLMPDPTEPPNLDCPSGRGILLMRTFMDEVAYNETGNRITLTKRCNSKPLKPHAQE
jgi:CheY-like chemotaxis protein